MIKWSIYPAGRFDEFSSQWDQLNQQLFNSLILDSRFVGNTLKYFGSGKEVLAVCHSDNELKGMAILTRVGFGQWQSFQASQSPLGAWLIDPSVISESFYQSLLAALPGFNLQLSVTQIDPVHYPRPQESARLKTLDYITTGRLEVPEDFEAYWETRSRNVKQNFNRANNRLKKQDIEVVFRTVNDSNLIDEAVSMYGDIESGSWKAEGGTSVSRDNSQGKFYKELLQAFVSEQGEVWQYLYNKDVVATDLCIHDGSTIYILKTTYIEDWKKYSPAFHMHIDGIKNLSERGINSIEFYGPAMEWHKKLTEDLRAMYHVNFSNYPLLVAFIKQIINLFKFNNVTK